MGEASEREYDTTLIFKHLYVHHPFRIMGPGLTKCILFIGASTSILQRMHV